MADGSPRVARLALLALVAALGGLALLGPAGAQQIHRNSFEAREPAWLKGPADAPFREAVHEMTDLTAHTGQLSEHIDLNAEQGSYIYYLYPTAQAPVNEELTASVWVKANRPGTQLLARLVLPKMRNPNNLEERLTTLLRGDQYQTVGRWQRLEIRRPLKLAKEQQQLMRAELRTDVDLTDAYIDRLQLNVYGGPGKTEVWIDDLEIGPVVDSSPFRPTSRVVPGAERVPGTLPRRGPVPQAVVAVNQGRLMVGPRPFLARGIRYSDTPLQALREVGLNTVWCDYTTPPAKLDEAVNLGFWVVPSLPATSEDSRLASDAGLTNEVARVQSQIGDAVLFWDLGGGLVEEQTERVNHAGELVHAADPQRPLGADIWDGFRPYSRTLDLVGVHRWPLLTSLELTQYRDWLDQRRLLARPGSYLWTWVQTHLPDWYTSLVYDRPGAAGFAEPIGPQPEQIRLLTYIALAAGCRGIGYWSDRFLADTHQGRDRLLELALLNQELAMLEPLLITAAEPRWIATSVPEVKAAVLRTEHGMLVLPMWLGRGAQFVPGQEATARLTMVVPEVPAGTQAWLVSPADVRSLQTLRTTGGTAVGVPEFDMTAAIVFTGDNGPGGLLVRLQQQVQRTRKLAAQYAYQLASVEYEKVGKVAAQLEADGHAVRDGRALLEKSQQYLKSSVAAWDNGDYTQAYFDAERACRPLRILMRAQWEEAVRGLDSAVATPYAVSFFTLPRHHRFMDQVRRARAGANLLADGGFEVGTVGGPDGWQVQQARLDAVTMTAQRVTQAPHDGAQCLKLEIKPQMPQAAPRALERTFLGVRSPTVHLQPGSLVRVSGWVRIRQPITASPDGALVYDSVGGEPLGLRLTQPTINPPVPVLPAKPGQPAPPPKPGTEWRPFTLYRTVPASGQVSVTLALTGLGTVWFDDIRIEPLEPATYQAAGMPYPGPDAGTH